MLTDYPAAICMNSLTARIDRGFLILILIKLIKQKEVFQNEIKIQETNSSDPVGYADN